MIETELKFKLNGGQLSSIKKLLKEKGKVLRKRVKEETTMYDNPEKIMLITDGRVRVRTWGENAIFSYKKPITRKKIKQEIELETEVSDAQTLIKILKKMNFQAVSGYWRYRSIWQFQQCHVFLDQFSFGNYLEIEGSIKKVQRVARVLGLCMNDNLTGSYDGIYKKICQKRKTRPLTFFH